MKPVYREVIKGVIVLICVAISWTAAVQFGKSSLTSSAVNGPFFLTWFGTAFMTLCYPIFFIGYLIYVTTTHKSDVIKDSIRYHALVQHISGQSTLSLAYACFLFALMIIFTGLWLLANYSYNVALMRITATEASVVSSSNMAFVYILSLMFLRDDIELPKILALLLTGAGNAVVAYASGFGSFGFYGVIFAIVSAASAACYKVFLKKTFPCASLGQISFFLSILGCFNLVCFVPIAASLLGTGNESVVWTEAPWGFIIGSAILNLAFNFFVNFGIALTHPLYVSIGMFSGIPLNAFIDFVVRHASFSSLQLVGSLLIIVSLIILTMPPLPCAFCSLKIRKEASTHL